MRDVNVLGARQKPITLRAKMKNILDVAKEQNRDLNQTEEAEFEKLKVELARANAHLAEVEAEVELSRQMPVEAVISGGGCGQWQLLGGAIPAGVLPRAGHKRTYESIFGATHGDTRGFHSMGDFVRSVSNSRSMFDPRLKAAATEGVPSDGGFLVPTEYSAMILSEALESSIVLPRAQVWPLKSDSLRIPAVRDEDHSSDTLYGGVAIGWVDELETLPDAIVKTRQLGLSAKKLGLLTNASNELVEDSTYESVITSKLQSASSWGLDVAFMLGDGVKKPLGFLNAGNTALLTVSKESTQAADSFVWENATKMFQAMAPRSRQRAVWIFNDGLLPQLLSLQLVVTNKAGSENVGGSATPLFSMNPDGTGQLLGRPVLLTEKLPSPGNLNDCCFVDLTEYVVGMRRDFRLESSNQPGFTNDSMYYRLTCRVDGQPAWEAKLKQRHGTYCSPYVTLEAR